MMLGMPARIREVAERAGVSTATVSRVLTGRQRVRPELAERVHAAVDELGYRPNGQARGLRTQSSSLLGLVIPDITNPFFTSLARGVEDVAQREGYAVVLANSDDSVQKEQRCLQVAAAQQLAGVVLSVASSRYSRLDLLVEHGIPVVTVDQRLRQASVDSVQVNNRAVAAAATRHLIERGRKRIGMIAGPRTTSTGADRLAGYRDAIRHAGWRRDDSLVTRAGFDVEGGYSGTLSLIGNVPDLDGLLVANNSMTLGALDALEDLGVGVPDQLTVVGFDEYPWSTGVHRQITVVRQPTYAIGQKAGELLLQRIRGSDAPPQNLVLQAELVHGSRTGPRSRQRPRT